MSKTNYTGGQVLVDAHPGLKKKKFTLAAMTFFIYCACAGGAFGIETMISSAGPGLTLILLVLIPLLWGMPIGLYSSELTNLAPVESGPYVWAKMAFGEFWGFSFGFWIALAMYLTGAAYVVLAVNYIGMFVSLTPVTAFLLKAAIIIVFTIVNLMGLEEVSTLSTIFSIIILLAFAAVAVVGIVNWQYSPFDPIVPEGQGALSSWGTGIAVGVWMYCGYVAISFLGGEIENPQVIPKGMKIGILVITLSYVLPTLGGIVSTGPWTEWGISIDYSSVLYQHVGTWAGVAFMIVAVIAQCAIFNAAIASASRSFMVLGQDYLCPKFLSKVSKNRKVPVWPILILAAINLILVNLNFEVLVTILSPVLFVLYVGLGFAYVKIRKEYPVEKRGDLYYVKSKFATLYICGGPLIVGIISFLVNGTEYFLLGFIAIIAAVIFYPICKWIYGGFYKKDKEQHPINPKTKLAKGDLVRFGWFFLLFGIIAFLGSFFLVWYEGSWGPDYYLETYGSGIMSNFWGMINIARWGGVAMLVLGAIFFLVGKKVDPVPKD
ncbi:APC family permease [Anaerovorax odorimutans]|uniref:APC family permease n=1 Tax=Anaerovorax odorimutans TaxID=109327 RepID=A0ABT1RQ39_9FIRM|nr:APC family permease [Anaerovorax odorimutans]MCQ4637312.1 APC family permease [Anaerovorax odorimutans]